MCDKCNPKEHKRYWLHIADDWTLEEQEEMMLYLLKQRVVRTSTIHVNI